MKGIAARVLLTLLAIGLVLLPVRDRVLSFVFGPDGDPRFFCTAPDPSPLPTIESAKVLQECSAGETVAVRSGEIIAVDLPAGLGVDTSATWNAFSVSDHSVLDTIAAPSVLESRTTDNRGITRIRQDTVSLYRAAKAGESTISAVQTWCTANGGGYCNRPHRWSVRVQVK